jgi:hypothetical protein
VATRSRRDATAVARDVSDRAGGVSGLVAPARIPRKGRAFPQQQAFPQQGTGLNGALNGAKLSLPTLFVASFVESQPVRP